MFRRTPLSAEYNIFDSERYVLTLDNRALRDAAAAPHEFIEILVNEQTYGGGVDFQRSGHRFGRQRLLRLRVRPRIRPPFCGAGRRALHVGRRLRDRRRRGSRVLEPNVTALRDPVTLKWRDLVTPGTPLPTPWAKEVFEKQSRAIQERRREIRKRNAPEAEMDALFSEQQAAEEKLLGEMKFAKAVGAFEGASYEAKGLYRPQADCIMFSRDRVGFCAVCRRAIARIIDLYSR